MKKVIASVLAVMMMATAFAGCNGNNNGSSAGSETQAASGANTNALGDEDNISLKVWGPDKSIELLQKQCDAFKAQYPDKKIDIKVVAQGESDAATNMLNDPDAAADVFGIPSDQVTKLVNASVISEVADFYATDVKANNNANSVDAATIDGKLYAFPESDNGYYLVYDKSTIKEGNEAKLETILEDCKAAGKQFIMSAGDGFYACMFAFTGGCKIDGLDADGVQKFTDYDEDTAIKTLQAFSKLFHDYSGTFTSLEVTNIASGFAGGTCGAGIDGAWDAAANEQALGDNYGAAKLPTINVDGKDTQIVSMFGYKYVAVNSHTKFPRTSQALANYLAGEECQKQRAEQLAWGSTNNVVAASDTVKNNATLSAIAAQSEFAVPQANIADNFWDPMGNLGNKLVAEDTDPSNADAMKKLLDQTIANIKDA